MTANNSSSFEAVSLASEVSGIVKTEVAGQQTLVNSASLPKEARGIKVQDGWSLLERWGVVRHENDGDLFVKVTLPQGWKVAKTDHYLWSNLLDENGLKRASIFHKSAIYDRAAFMNVISDRYYCTEDYEFKGGCTYQVADAAHVGDEKTVMRFPQGFYALKQGALGFLFDGQFYSKPRGEYTEAYFTQATTEVDDVQPITDDVFYRDYHHKTPVHDVIYASRNKASEGAKAYADQLNAESSW